ncbi:MAG: alpha/beta hydrolase [Alphaproteobacteria bacterium]|jgi:arylformamidase|nr:alpha/beta hydrolase [Alphaproteobacteria bacterium]
MNEAIFRDYDAEELERQFNPRVFTPNHEEIFNAGVERSAAYRAAAAGAIFDLAYGPSALENLDLFRPDGDAGFPVHIYIHGGFWRSRDKADFSYVAGPLVEAGAAVAVVNYALCPDVTLDEIVRQMRACCAWLWRNAADHGGDPERIHVSGHSAGGHLVAILLATDWPKFESDLPEDLVKSGVPISGVFDIAPVIHTSVNELVQLDEDAARRNSPILMQPATAAPIAVVVGGGESHEFRRQSKELAERWGALAPAVEYLEMPGLDHFTILSQTADRDNPLTEARLRLMGLG